MRRPTSILPVLWLSATCPALAQGAPEAAPRADAAAAPAPQPARTLTLDEALATARARQPLLRQARAGTAAAAARADQARAPLLPQASATAQYQRTTENFVPRPGSVPRSVAGGGGTSLTTDNFFQAGVTLSQLVYDFGQTSGRWNAAKVSAEAQRDSERATALQTTLAVRTAFFTARANQDLVVVARENLANQELHLRQTEAFVRIGTRPEIDLALARTARANAQVQLINAENAYDTAKAQLNQAMGVEGPTEYAVASETIPPVPGEDQATDPLVAEAVQHRPDITALEEQARAQELTAHAVEGGYGPTLGVSTGVTEGGTALDTTVGNWNATATLTWNFFQGGLTRAQSQEARANLDAARAQVDTLRQQVRVDVEQARLAVRASKGALSAAGEALANAKDQLRLAEGRYKAGAGSAIELADAQVALTTAAAQRVQADYNLAASRAQLVRALGREDA
jgi:outer membrane protein